MSWVWAETSRTQDADGNSFRTERMSDGSVRACATFLYARDGNCADVQEFTLHGTGATTEDAVAELRDWLRKLLAGTKTLRAPPRISKGERED